MNHSPQPLLGLSFQELEDLFTQAGYPKYRVKQVYEWVFHKKVLLFEHMTNLPKNMIEWLQSHLCMTSLQVEDVLSSKKDQGTFKTVFRTQDQHLVETVMMPNAHQEYTLCISSQIGCSMNCDFCATGKMELTRSLHIEEVLGQFLLNYQQHPISNIVFMGMGEPFLNNSIFDILDRLTSPEYFNFPSRSITISTVGILEGIHKMIDYKQVGLALSYHSSIPETREVLFPALHMRHSIDEIMDTLIAYHQKTHKRITLEYTLIHGINDTPEEAQALIQLFDRMYFFLNIIPFNAHKFAAYLPPSETEIKQFVQMFPSSMPLNVRRSKGQDISAACGQLVKQLSE